MKSEAETWYNVKHMKKSNEKKTFRNRRSSRTVCYMLMGTDFPDRGSIRPISMCKCFNDKPRVAMKNEFRNRLFNQRQSSSSSSLSVACQSHPQLRSQLARRVYNGTLLHSLSLWYPSGNRIFLMLPPGTVSSSDPLVHLLDGTCNLPSAISCLPTTRLPRAR